MIQHRPCAYRRRAGPGWARPRRPFLGRVGLAAASTAAAAALLGVSRPALAAAGSGATETAAPAPSGDELAARAMFDEGLRKMANGQFAEAKVLFDEISMRYPASSYAESARSMSAMAASRISAAGAGAGGAAGTSGSPREPFGAGGDGIGGAGAGTGTGSPAAEPAGAFVDVPGAVGGESFGEGAEAYSRLVLKRRARRAQIQLMVGAGIWGGFAGAAAIGIANPNVDSGPATLIVLLPFVGAAAGVGGAYFLTSDIADLSDGDVSAVVGAGAWGLLNGMLGGLLAQENLVGINGRGVLGLTLTGSGVGLAAGSLAAYALRPDAGTMGLMNSGAIWGSVAALLLAGVFQAGSPWPWWLVGLDGGLVIGLGLGAFLDVSRARAAFLDLGAGIGLAAGFLSGAVVSSLINNGDVPAPAFAAGALGGMLLGIGVTWFITAKYDAKRKERDKLLERSLTAPVSAPPPDAPFAPPDEEGDGDEPAEPAPGIRLDVPAVGTLSTPGLLAGDPRAMPAIGLVLGGSF